MVKPINQHNLGTDGITVTFNTGSGVATGYVIKQMGTNKFRVTDGIVTKQVRLAQTTAGASAPTAGFCTIPITTTNGAEYVARIWDTRARTTGGHTVRWSLGQSVNGSAFIATYSGVLPHLSMEQAKPEPQVTEEEVIQEDDTPAPKMSKSAK